MTRTAVIRLLLAALIGFAVAAATLGVLVLTNAERLSGSTLTSDLGWSVPLLAAVTCAAVGWALLRNARGAGPSCDWRHTGSVCPACGGSVRADWRLCPHCGDRLPV